jgi:hypothetical protein
MHPKIMKQCDDKRNELAMKFVHIEKFNGYSKM